MDAQWKPTNSSKMAKLRQGRAKFEFSGANRIQS